MTRVWLLISPSQTWVRVCYESLTCCRKQRFYPQTPRVPNHSRRTGSSLGHCWVVGSNSNLTPTHRVAPFETFSSDRGEDSVPTFRPAGVEKEFETAVPRDRSNELCYRWWLWRESDGDECRDDLIDGRFLLFGWIGLRPFSRKWGARGTLKNWFLSYRLQGR